MLLGTPAKQSFGEGRCQAELGNGDKVADRSAISDFVSGTALAAGSPDRTRRRAGG